MSAALQLPAVWAASSPEIAWRELREERELAEPTVVAAAKRRHDPYAGLAFYRKHTEGMLRRYLYASMMVGRTPEMLGDSVGRGWVSSRPVRTFEDAVIFVLDVEGCLKKLNALDRRLLTR